MPPCLGLFLCALASAAVGGELEEVLYAAASPSHHDDSSGSHHAAEPPLSVPSDDATDEENALVQDIVQLIQSVSSPGQVESAGLSPEERKEAAGQGREARQMNLGAATGRIRSLLNIPFGHGQGGFIPRTPLGGGIFYGAGNPASGWQQRFMNTFSNLFSFGRPNQMLPYGGIGQASTHQPAFVPYPALAAHHPPYHHQFHHGGDLSQSATYGHPTRLQLGNTFNPYYVPQQQPHQFGPDLATSGSGMSPYHQGALPGHFGRYAVPPKHTPLFQGHVDGLKGASLEMGNAFADFADSHEHGPEVTQKFGSVGHTLNTFLGMMGLGPNGGITDDVGGFGGGGEYASADPTPISRSMMDFYPGYGNQAVLEEMEDYPIFQEDITRAYLTRMNLTHLLDHVSVHEKDSSNAEEGDVHVLEITAKDPETGKDMKPKYIVSGMDADSLYAHPSEKALYHFFKDPNVPTYSTEEQAQLSTKSVETPETSKSKPDKDGEEEKVVPSSLPAAHSPEKKPWLLDLKKTPAEESSKESSTTEDKKESAKPVPPSVNYKVPPTHSPVAVRDRVPPVATFAGFPPAEAAPAPPEYAPAHSLPPHHDEDEDDPNGLIDENEVRSWVPVSGGFGDAEKGLKSTYEVNEKDEIPRVGGMTSLVRQLLLAGMSSDDEKPDSLQE